MRIHTGCRIVRLLCVRCVVLVFVFAFEYTLTSGAFDREFRIFRSAYHISIGIFFGPWIPIAQHVRLNKSMPNVEQHGHNETWNANHFAVCNFFVFV